MGAWSGHGNQRWTNRGVEAHISVRGRILTAINCSLRIRFVCCKISGVPRTRTYDLGMGCFGCFNPTNFREGSGFFGVVLTVESILIIAFARWFV